MSAWVSYALRQKHGGLRGGSLSDLEWVISVFLG
jgi:hypothetical protein